MRHGNKVNHLGRKTAHRKAMLMNMACSLIQHKRIKTTVAKARELRKFIEPLVNKAKVSLKQNAADATHTRRIVFSRLRNKEAIKELFGTVAYKVADREGGYTRILKIGNRLGDNAEMAIIELTDFNDFLTATGSTSKRRRRQKTAAPKVETTTTAEVVTPSVEENVETPANDAADTTENTEK
ncbi:MAG: 50S ribosomal protein L17 [Bacteroidia bacterium]